MKKIITAMGNEVLNNELKKFAKYDVLLEDLFCQDIVISKLGKTDADVLVISGLLQGQWDLEEFVEKIRKINKYIRIIVIVDEVDPNMKNILEKNNILDIFSDSTVEIKDIVDAIDREENVRKKYEMINENVPTYDLTIEQTSEEKIVFEKMVQKQEIITFSGVSGAGKSTIAANFCKVLSQKSDAKILLIDLDTLYGNLDEILEINRVPQNVEVLIDEDKKAGVNYAVELIMKNRFDANVLDELVLNVDGFDVLTGNTSLHYCQNVMKEEYYEKILKCAKEKYDFIVIDTSSNIFLDSTRWALSVATRILFLTEGNYLSLKKMQQFINIVTNIWGVWKPKIELIVNKKDKNSIENEIILQVMEGLKLVGEIKFNEEKNINSYEKILANINYIPKKNIIEKILEIKNNLFSNNINKSERGAMINAN